MKNKEPTKLIERNKDTGIDLEVKVNKKTGKIYYEGNTTLFDNSAVHKLLGVSLPKDIKERADAAVNIDTCINIYKNLLKKKTAKDITKLLDNTIAPSAGEYIKNNKDDEAYTFFFNPEKFDKDKRIDLLHKKFKEIDNFYFDAEKTFTGRLYAYCLMLYTISLGGITFDDKKKHAEKIWQSLFTGINKSKVFNINLIPMTFRKKFNGWGKQFSMEVFNENEYQTFYEGNFKNGLFSGKGKWSSKQGRSYEGNFKNGLRHGKGTSIDSKGERLTCNFVNDKPVDGKGELIYANGSKYIGNFKNNHLHGKGTLTNKKKKIKIVAYFENSQPIKIIKTIPLKGK